MVRPRPVAVDVALMLTTAMNLNLALVPAFYRTPPIPASPVRHGLQHGLTEVAAGDLAIVVALQRRCVQAVVVLRDHLLCQLRRVTVEVRSLSGAHVKSDRLEVRLFSWLLAHTPPAKICRWIQSRMVKGVALRPPAGNT